jgi:16S rRNA (guanine527-N7)-methyltransferase
MDQLPDWLDVSRETAEKLQAYADQVLRWNDVINLVSKNDAKQIWRRHILDSAQLYNKDMAKHKWIDLGSGGGFPGVVMAIMGAENLTLVESDQRKAAFLREIARNLSLGLTVIPQRVEKIPLQNAKTLTARALASLTQLLPYANTHLAPSGHAIFPKGRTANAELQEAEKYWKFDYVQIPSRIDPESVILIIKNIQKK